MVDVYASREVQGLEPRVVLVGSPDADQSQVAVVLDAVAAAHGRIESPLIPAVDERGRLGVIEYLSLCCDAAVDLEAVFKRLSQTGEKGTYEVGMAFIELVQRTVATAHATPTEAGEPHCLGAICWANVLISPDGRPWLLGFGHNFPVLSRTGEFGLSPGLCRATDVALGGRVTTASDVFAVHAFYHSLASFADLPDMVMNALAGRASEETQGFADALAQTHASVGAMTADQRVQSMDVLIDMYAAVRTHHSVRPDPPALRAFFGAQAAAIIADLESEWVQPGAAAALATGRHWQGGRYRLERPLDSGATSTVFLGWDRQLEQRVAMKVLPGGCTDTLRRRFHREVRILRSVRHPHLVRGFDLFEEAGRLVGILEFVEGERLDTRLARGDTPDADIVSWIGHVFGGLTALHAMGVVHRDVKPANIIVSPIRGAVLVDFGVAAEVHSDVDLTATGGIVGTLGYMAPEQLNPRALGPLGPAADVFALSAVLLSALSGEEPFPAVDVTDALRQRQSIAQRIDRLSVPVSVREALRDGLSMRPEQRPTAAEMGGRLEPRVEVSSATLDLNLEVLRVQDGARQVQLPSGEHVDLSRRRAPRRIVDALVRQHQAHPGVPLTWEDLQEAGWPGEVMTFDSGRGRVYVAIYTLRRKLGFEEVIERHDEGYLLAPGLAVDAHGG